MAWKNRRHPDTYKAFGRDTHVIATSINRLATLHFDLSMQDFSPDDLLNLFVPQELHDLLRDSFAEAAPRTGYELYVAMAAEAGWEATRDQVVMRFSWDHRLKGGFLPRTKAGAYRDHPASHVYADCPTDVVERWQQVCRDLCEISYRYGMVRWVFDKLNEVGNTPAAVRYHFPCVVALLDRANMKDVADAIREPNSRAGDNLVIPSKVREYIRPANEFVARAMLMEGVAKKPMMNYGVCPVTYHSLFDGWWNAT